MNDDLDDLLKTKIEQMEATADFAHALKMDRLRDYFAGQALAGILARPEYEGPPVPAVAYAYADAMIAEREK